MQFKRIKSRTPDKTIGILCDQDILLTGINSTNKYPEHLRRIKFYDAEFESTFVFLTNHFKIKPQTVTQLYKHRWGIELFFKWIKQNLKIQCFWGFSENAVKNSNMGCHISLCSGINSKKEIEADKLSIRNYTIHKYHSFRKRSLHNVFLNIENQDLKELKYIH